MRDPTVTAANHPAFGRLFASTWLSGRSPVLDSPAKRALFLAGVGCAFFFLPYLFPVAPSVSLSYVTGFNNRVAFVIFFCGSMAFALLSRGEMGFTCANDERLGVRPLFVSMFIVVVLCAINLYPFAHFPHGIEAQYALNRVQMLVSGGRPYRDFEFAYGPAHLFVPLVLIRMLGCSAVAAYYMWWVMEWLVGSGMLWAFVRYLDLPLQRRRFLFWAFLLAQLSSVGTEGTIYTPLRIASVPFIILGAHYVWRRWRSPMLSLAAGIGGIVYGLCISPELGVGVAVGLLCWYGLLAACENPGFSWSAYGMFAVGLFGVFALFNRLGAFLIMKTFASGAYSFPAVPALPVCLILFAYIVSACIAARKLLQGDYESMSVPLVAAGFAMLPAALGRCDIGHLQIAAPALIVGIAGIEGIPAVRNWWRPLALYSLLLPMGIAGPIANVRSDLQRIRHFHPTSATNTASCTGIYRTPNVWPPAALSAKDDCLDTGYYIAAVNAFTPASIQRKIADLDRIPRVPVILFDKPLSEQMETIEADPSVLEYLEGPSLFHPRVRHQPLTYAPIFDYIQQNYVPDPEAVQWKDGWQYRIWRPKQVR